MLYQLDINEKEMTSPKGVAIKQKRKTGCARFFDRLKNLTRGRRGSQKSGAIFTPCGMR
jgi:hypothetical protein